VDNQLSDVTAGEANAEDTTTRSVSGPKETAGSGYSYENEVVVGRCGQTLSFDILG